MSDTRKTKTPAIPAVPRRVNESILPFLTSVKEALEVRMGQRGDRLDKAVTWRDLVETGIAKYKGRGFVGTPDALNTEFTPSTDTTTPVTPVALTGLVVTAGMATVFLEWDDPTTLYSEHAYTEIWRAETDNLSVATLVGSSPGFIYVDAVGRTDRTYYYWIRAVSTTDTTGPYNAVSGTSGAPNKIGNVDLGPLIVEAGNLATGAVSDPTKIANAAVGNAAIANLAVTNAKLGNAAVDNAKLATAAVGEANIQTAAVSTAKIQDAAVTTAKIGTAQVTTLLIGNNQVTVPVVDTAYQSSSVTSWLNPSSASYTNPVQVSLALAYAADVLIQFSCTYYMYGTFLNDQLLFYLYDGSTFLVPQGTYLGGLASPDSGTNYIMGSEGYATKASLAAGTHTIYLGIKQSGNGGYVRVGNFALTATAAYR